MHPESHASKKRPRVAFQFRPVPLDLSPTWHEVSFYQRMVGLEAYRVLGGDPCLLGPAWMDQLCRLMAVDGTERRAVKKALLALVEKGLLVVIEGAVQVVLEAMKAVRGVFKARSNPDQNAIKAGSKTELTVENDSGHPPIDLDLDLDQRKEGEKAPTEPAAPPPKIKGLKKRDADKELLRKALADEARQMGLYAFSIPSRYLPEVLAKARANAEVEGLTLEESVRQIAREGVTRAKDAQKEPKWGVVDWQPSRALRSVKKGIAPCAPSSAFRDQDHGAMLDALGW